MKKSIKLLALLCATLILLAAFASCETKSDNNIETDSQQGSVLDTNLKINVAVLNGTTGFGAAKMISDSKDGNSSLNYSFTVDTAPANIQAGLINGSIDIAALPTNAAAALYKKSNGAIKIAAVNTLGVLYLMTNGENVTAISDISGKTVYCPANNPAYIFEAICRANGLENGEDYTLQTIAEPADVQKALASGEASIAVIPEPLASAARAANTSLVTALDLTAEWEKVYGENTLMQGCIVVRTAWANAHPKELEKFLEDYKASIEFTNADPKAASEMIVTANIFAKAPVAEKAIPKCNIVYIDGNEMATSLSVFFEKLYAVNPQAVGGAIPDSGIYIEK